MTSSFQNLSSPPGDAPLGAPIPNVPHALSVSLPTWDSNVGWASGDQRIVSVMDIGYPRFFVHRSIQKLADLCNERVHGPTDQTVSAMLFPTSFAADQAVMYIRRQAILTHKGDKAEVSATALHIESGLEDQAFQLEMHVIRFPIELWKIAKSFWQHAGLGVSSRYAEMILELMKTSSLNIGPAPSPILRSSLAADEKVLIRRRLCHLYDQPERPTSALNGITNVNSAQVSSGRVSMNDTYLYPTGMAAIWHAHQACMELYPARKSASFGFTYTDTFKVLEKWGPGAYLFFDTPDENIEKLEQTLIELKANPSPSIAAVFCELPSNPLLLSPDLPRLRELADEYGFVLVLDNTVGDPVTVDVLEYVDVMVTSLSKMFSGSANVMGGSLILNDRSPHYAGLKKILEQSYKDDYYHEDAIVMELNCRDFVERVHRVNANATALCEFILPHCLSDPNSTSTTSPLPQKKVIRDLFFPKFVSRRNFDLVRRKSSAEDSSGHTANNFGALFTMSFTSLDAAGAFYDAFPCAKGPSLGTNFTLSCPYTLLGHYNEREWVAKFGVLEEMVRVSVGMEDIALLKGWFSKALAAAERAEQERVDQS